MGLLEALGRRITGVHMYTDDRYGYSQSLPLGWLQVPEDWDRASLLEFSRGSLCSLSAREDGRFDAVHVSRIQRSFKKIGAPTLYKGGLRLLKLLREAESLFGGYWIPAPFRVVEIEGEYIFIGATPNAHGLLGDVRSEGLSRLLDPDVAEKFPRQSLESWMGAAPQDLSTVVATFTSKHTRTAARTSNLVNVECLRLAPEGANAYRTFEWCDQAIAMLPKGQIAICRQPHGGRVRYFSASLRSGHIVMEASIDIPISRLLFAIAHHIGAPVKVAVRPRSHGVEFTLNERLPIEEFRLALLLSRKIVRSGRLTTFVIPPKLAPAFSARMAVLGCALETLR